MNTYKSYFSFSYVKHQLLFAFLMVSIIPITIISILSIHNTRKQLTDQYQSLLMAEATRINSTLSDFTTSIYTNCEPILTQYNYQQLFSADSYDSNILSTCQSLESLLNNMLISNAAISSVKIYTNNPNIPLSNIIIYNDNNYSDQEWYSNLENAPNKLGHWSCTNVRINQLGQTFYELTLSRRFSVPSSEYTAYLVVTLDDNYTRNRLLYTDHYVLASLNNQPIFLASDSRQLLKSFPFPTDFKGGPYRYIGAMEINDSDMLTCVSSFWTYKTDDNFYVLVSDFSAYAEINRITLNYMAISIIAFLFPFILIWVFASNFSSRIIILRKAMHQASLGDYNIIDSFHGSDELSQTFEDLKNTIDHIREQEVKIYEEKLARQALENHQQQIEFKMLANQINPHFLYNTLEAIRMQALTNHDKEVAESVKLLGKAMHYVLENTKNNATTLNQEMDYIRVYLSIQQLRFPNRIRYFIELDETITPEHCRILPLLIQPLVENAVIHGLKGVKDGHISIVIKSLPDEQIQILVSDNGNGIDTNTLQTLNNQDSHDHSDNISGIGLNNIKQRISLYYGCPYGMQIDSILGQGTTVTLVLPLINLE